MVRSSRPRPHHWFSVYVSTIEINAYGYHTSHALYKLRHHVNMQFNKKYPQLVMQCNKRWGHDFTRNREGNYSNPWANSVEPSVNGRTHKEVNYLFFLIHPIIYFFQKLVEVVNALGRERYGSSNSYWGKPSILENLVFSCGERKHQEIGSHSIPHLYMFFFM